MRTFFRIIFSLSVFFTFALFSKVFIGITTWAIIVIYWVFSFLLFERDSASEKELRLSILVSLFLLFFTFGVVNIYYNFAFDRLNARGLEIIKKEPLCLFVKNKANSVRLYHLKDFSFDFEMGLVVITTNFSYRFTVLDLSKIEFVSCPESGLDEISLLKKALPEIETSIEESKLPFER